MSSKERPLRAAHCDGKAELAVLSAAIESSCSIESSGALIERVAAWLEPKHFYYDRNARLYQAALALYESGAGISYQSVKAWLDDRKLFQLSDFDHMATVSDAPVDVRIEENAKRIIEKYRLEQMVKACERTVLESLGFTGDADEFAARLESRIFEVTEDRVVEPAIQVFTVKRLLAEVAEDYVKATTASRCTFGVADLDEDLGGLASEAVSVVGADTNWGKTNVAVFIADENMAQGKRVLIVSFEDSERIYGRRLASRRAALNAARLRDRRLESDEFQRLLFATAAASEEPVLLRAIGIKAETAANRIKTLCKKHSIDLVVIDYLQAVRLSRQLQDRRNEVTEIARIFTDTIKNANAAGLVFSQLRRMGRDERRPTMHHLKESGDIENGAENVLLGYRKGQHYRLLTGKGKDGCRAEYELQWDPSACCFRGGSRLAEEPQEQPKRHSRYEPRNGVEVKS